jgi:adenylate cyclase
MEENEEATHRTLTSYRKLIDSLIEQHHGRFVNSAVDGVLAEFASVVNAIQCAVDVAHRARIARSQQAGWWELRATVSLAHLLAKQGKRDEAQAILERTMRR